MAPLALPSKVRRVCTSCPFRTHAKLGYDADAMEWLEKGYEPSCHLIAGLDGIFNEILPSDTERCAGYDAWQEGLAGFSKPKAGRP